MGDQPRPASDRGRPAHCGRHAQLLLSVPRRPVRAVCVRQSVMAKVPNTGEVLQLTDPGLWTND